MAVRGAKACVGIPTVQRAALLGDSGGEGGDVGTLESLAALAQDKMQTDVEKAVVLRSASASGYVNVVRWLLLHGEVSSVIDGANVPHRTWARERKEARGRARQEREKLLVLFEKEAMEKLMECGQTKEEAKETMEGIMESVVDKYGVGSSSPMQDGVRSKNNCQLLPTANRQLLPTAN